jgi:hypothetical protein
MIVAFTSDSKDSVETTLVCSASLVFRFWFSFYSVIQGLRPAKADENPIPLV